MWRRELVIALFYPLLRANAQASKLRSCFEPVTVVASQRQHPVKGNQLVKDLLEAPSTTLNQSSRARRRSLIGES